MGTWMPSIVRGDAATVRAIEEALAWALLAAPSPPIRAALADGTVTLEGTVRHWSQRYDAEHAVACVPGVSRVLNKNRRRARRLRRRVAADAPPASDERVGSDLHAPRRARLYP